MTNIKAILFDLDGVLFETRQMHYEVLNDALKKYAPNYVISLNDHELYYDGLSTKQKLQLLHEKHGLDKKLFKPIFDEKQTLTLSWIETNIKTNYKLKYLFKHLVIKGYAIGVVSNSIHISIKQFLIHSGIIDYCGIIISNEDVEYRKPHCQPYIDAIAKLKISPNETLIVEDNTNGCNSALSSGAHVLHVSNPSEVTIINIEKTIATVNKKENKLNNRNLNIVIPMAGDGTRFNNAGYNKPKPLIDVEGLPMIKLIYDTIGLNANYTFIIKKDHVKKYNIDSILKIIDKNCNIVTVDETTQGAACTVLLAKEIINNNDPLLIVNSDQYIEWNYPQFMQKVVRKDADASMLTFESSENKWSYAKINENQYVTQVAEKNPISNNATCGLYWYRYGKDFVKYAEQMISKNIRVNNEFYVCPVFNEFINDNKKVIIHQVDKFYGLGTPEDLDNFLDRK